MTGRFKCRNNVYLKVVMIAIFFAVMILGGITAFAVKDAYILIFITIAAVIVMVLLWLAELTLLGEGTFTADNDKVTFRIGFIKRTYGYSEINSTVTQTGFTHRQIRRNSAR